ncbi:MAG: hypothetical protein ACPG6V_03825 [Flavobacteriales bacterium]
MLDNGLYPDKRSGDGIYSVVVDQNPDEFIEELVEKQNAIENQGYVLDFNGHIGTTFAASEIKPFNVRAFNSFVELELNPLLANMGPTCSFDIKKRNSLFITDKEIVENQARTYNVVTGQGSPQGAWTFGQMMKNMAGGFEVESAPTNDEVLKVRDFVKQWVEDFYKTYTVNGSSTYTKKTNPFQKFFLDLWLKKAKNDLSYQVPGQWPYDFGLVFDEFNTPEKLNDLLSNAPFKLTAIVNRLDLRGNAGYGGSIENSGETRFVFTLIETIDIGDNLVSNVGNPPFHDNVSEGSGANSQAGSRIDWQGMNVIFEYGNVLQTGCDIKEHAEGWRALSDYDLDLPSDWDNYCTDLQVLTDHVTTRNANPNKPNGSAINQVRTNERLFETNLGSNWEGIDWELREFQIDEATGLLRSSPVKNMPLPVYNYSRNNTNGYYAGGNSSEGLVNWMYGVTTPGWPYWSVYQGNHNIPDHLLAASSIMEDDHQSYYGIGFWHGSFPDNIYDDENWHGEASEVNKTVRQQLSLNTCMGCHGAETKTLFTMVRPIGYDQEIDYWSEVPSTSSGRIHNGNTQSNIGTTFDPAHPDANANGFVDNYENEYYQGQTFDEIRTVPHLSPFLTGRNYRGSSVPVNETWADDETSITKDVVGDNLLHGLFIVNDPSNEGDHLDPDFNHPGDADPDTPFPQIHDNRKGFNELEKRKEDLCLILSNDCSNDVNHNLFRVMSTVRFIPLPEHGH